MRDLHTFQPPYKTPTHLTGEDRATTMAAKTPKTTGGSVNIGQKGAFRMWGTTGPGTEATVQGHQDAGFLSLQLANGKFARFDPGTGLELEPDADVAGGWERVTFDSTNVMVVQPDQGVILGYEWFNRK
jgi:hypothetical protein